MLLTLAGWLFCAVRLRIHADDDAHRLLNAMIELVVVWRKVVFAAALRVTDLPPSTGWTAGGAGCLLRGGAILCGRLGASAELRVLQLRVPERVPVVQMRAGSYLRPRRRS